MTTEERTRGKNENSAAAQMISTKPLHRFIQKEPKCLGIVIVICGSAELLMGFQLATDTATTSCEIYVPFWQGLLFLVCGNLSIYTEAHPSKKMVTVSLAMYIVSLFGIGVSVGYRIFSLSHIVYLGYRGSRGDEWLRFRAGQLLAIEAILFSFSLCVSVLLIFLTVIARLALKSTHTGVIIQQIPAPQSDTPSS